MLKLIAGSVIVAVFISVGMVLIGRLAGLTVPSALAGAMGAAGAAVYASSIAGRRPR